MTTMPKVVTELDGRYSMDGASATEWSEAQQRLEQAELFWVITVRPDGRPHTTPLIAIWHDDALYFTTGPTEQKAKNLAANPHCSLMTGSNALHDGLDLIVEGKAKQVTDTAVLQRLADAYEAKYGNVWHFDVRDGMFASGENEAAVFRIRPHKVLAFAKEPHAQTTYRFH